MDVSEKHYAKREINHRRRDIAWLLLYKASKSQTYRSRQENGGGWGREDTESCCSLGIKLQLDKMSKF